MDMPSITEIATSEAEAHSLLGDGKLEQMLRDAESRGAVVVFCRHRERKNPGIDICAFGSEGFFIVACARCAISVMFEGMKALVTVGKALGIAPPDGMQQKIDGAREILRRSQPSPERPGITFNRRVHVRRNR